MPSIDLSEAERRRLLDLARRSIFHRLESGRPWRPRPEDYPESLRRPGATFVTLKRGGALRGCIGTLEAHQPLVLDVAEHAQAAAFSDPRFPPLGAEELDDLELSISLLGEPEPMGFTDEADLIRQLRPGRDGLILQEGGHKGTFLPSVWESLPEPAQFLRELKRKAGLPPDHWSPGLKVWRYEAEYLDDASGDGPAGRVQGA